MPSNRYCADSKNLIKNITKSLLEFNVMENSKNKIEKKEFTQAEVPAAPHKIVQRLKIDTDIDVRELYKEIIPLGLAEYFKKHNIDPATYNFEIGVTNLAVGQAKVNSQ